jgi:hypothetical protein
VYYCTNTGGRRRSRFNYDKKKMNNMKHDELIFRLSLFLLDYEYVCCEIMQRLLSLYSPLVYSTQPEA